MNASTRQPQPPEGATHLEYLQWVAREHRRLGPPTPAALRAYPDITGAVVEFRCAPCRRERRRENLAGLGTLMGVAIQAVAEPVPDLSGWVRYQARVPDPGEEPAWVWYRAQVARTPDGRRTVITGKYCWYLGDWCRDAPFRMRCRTSRHAPRRLPVADIIERARAAADGGYTSVHI